MASAEGPSRAGPISERVVKPDAPLPKPGTYPEGATCVRNANLLGLLDISPLVGAGQKFEKVEQAQDTIYEAQVSFNHDVVRKPLASLQQSPSIESIRQRKIRLFCGQGGVFGAITGCRDRRIETQSSGSA